MKAGRVMFRKAQKGSVLIEMAIVLPLLVLLLAAPLFYARVFWYYSVAEKAAHDAARYLSTVTQAEMRTPGGGFNEAKAAAVARWIAQQELEYVAQATISDGVLIDVQCDGSACGGGVPSTVHVKVQTILHDNIFGDFMASENINTDITLVSEMTLRYVGK